MPRACAWTPYGREASASILYRYLRRDHDAGLVDEWLLCMNTACGTDIAYARELAARHDWIRLCELPGGPGFSLIDRFYSAFLTVPDTVYLRFDDDVVYIHEQAIPRMTAAAAVPGVLAAFPVIINNAVVSWHLQQEGKVPLDHGVIRAPECLDPTGCSDPRFAEALHHHALGILEAGEPGQLFLDAPVTLGFTQRISVNAFALRGSELASGGSIGAEGEESWMTQVFPGRAGKQNMIVPDALVSHFSFHPTFSYLSGTGILARYRTLAEKLT